MPAKPNRELRAKALLILAVIVLTPSLLGFGNKFFEFMHTFRDDSSGAFAITPILNYLLASLGFLMLLAWATINGMFHDLERPKHFMLETEAALDRAERGGPA